MQKNLAVILILALLAGLFSACSSQSPTPEPSAAEQTQAEQSAPTPAAAAEPEQTSEAEPAAEPAAPAPEAGPAPSQPEEAPAASAEPPAPEPDNALPEETPEEPSDTHPASLVETAAPGTFTYELPLFEEQQSVSLWYPIRQGRSNLPAKEDGAFPFWNRLEENLNVDITFVEVGQTVATEQYNLLVASMDMPDIIYEAFCVVGFNGVPYTGGYNKVVEDEVYIDLAPYLQDYAPNYNAWVNIDEITHNSAFTDYGYLPTFAMFMEEPRSTNMGLIVSADMLDATGMDMPDTVSGWEDVFYAMKANGVEVPCYCDSSASALQDKIITAMGGSLTAQFLLSRDGEFVFAPTMDGTRDYIELMARWYQDGVIDHDFMSAASNDYTALYNGTLATAIAMGQELDSYEARYGVRVYPCPVIRSEGMAEGQVMLGSARSNYLDSLSSMAVTTSCQDIETAITLMDWFYSDGGYLASNYGWVESETYEFVNGEPMATAFYFETSEYSVANKTLYTVGEDFGLVNPNISLQNASPLQLQACEGWTEDTSAENYAYTSLPNGVSLSTEESDEITSRWTDIETLLNTRFLSWIVGNNALTDEAWTQLIRDVDSFGLEDCRDAYEAAYNRYINK